MICDGFFDPDPNFIAALYVALFCDQANFDKVFDAFGFFSVRGDGEWDHQDGCDKRQYKLAHCVSLKILILFVVKV